MQKASVMKGSGLKPLEDEKSTEVAHVFGKNLEERVITNDEEESPSISSFNILSEPKNLEEDDIDSIRKRKFDAITGEEDEETVFQGEFKLFVWDLSASNWVEKGRGQLKLNDSIGLKVRRSRIIMRVSGTLRIILNVLVKRSFFRVLTNSKTNIRFTDSQTVWAASGSNVSQLKDLIEERLKMSAEEENEIRKRSKSDADDASEVSSKKTRTSEGDEQNPAVQTSENESNDQHTSDKIRPSTDPNVSNKDEVACKTNDSEPSNGTNDEVNPGATEGDKDLASTKKVENPDDTNKNESSDEKGDNEGSSVNDEDEIPNKTNKDEAVGEIEKEPSKHDTNSAGDDREKS